MPTRPSASCERSRPAGDPELSFRYNRDFHFTVYRLSGMEMLVAHIESLWVWPN
ncbi:hypothetical protein [Mesorhizobium sp. RIZ17]|jgi:DNA-binding GntR family transcriptional regulator|uniref:hypothetical protein n=1 Tax=Mesorhizobium sp. RIZ17 TaxID=3132743 RepID=UPI003DA8FB78